MVRLGYVISRRRRAGFSLIEILVVAILLAIFAGLAAISIATVYRENQRKAVLAELSNYREAVGFAMQDIGIIPKLNFLQQPTVGIIDPSIYDPVLTTYDFHLYGYPIGEPRRELYAKRWNGPYIGSGRPVTSSRPTATDRAGYGRMLIASPVLTPANPDIANVVAWPIDLWGQPYVVYVMKVVRDSSSGVNRPVFVQTPYEEADYTIDFVSYGPNHYPGSFINELVPSSAEITRKEDQRLYRTAPVGVGYEFIWRSETDFRYPNDLDFLEGYSEQLFGNSNYIGSIDENSDDLHLKLQ